MQILKVFQCQKVMDSKIWMSLKRTNTKNRLPAVMAINQYVDNKFTKSFKSYLGEDAVYGFINNVIKESKYCTVIIKSILTKNL